MRAYVSRVAAAGIAGLMALAACPRAGGQGVAPELNPNLGWLNTDRPLRFAEELQGHVVLLDFWTYCCINCMNVLPDLEYLEHKYAAEPFVVIGVHSAKFTNESERRSIRNAVQRYGVRHPVVVDDEMAIWNEYGVRGWPTFVLVGADGRVVGWTSGEGNRDALDAAIAEALASAKARGALAAARFDIKLDGAVPAVSGLRFPGKVLAVAPPAGSAPGGPAGAVGSGHLFIADSTGNRVVWATYPDEQGMSDVVRVFGTGEPGLRDGGPDACAFHDPQGMAFDAGRGVLYVADRKNHAIRAVGLAAGGVTTLVGTGEQAYDRVGGKRGREQGLNAPWDVALSADGGTLYVAMAGPHQLWRVDPGTGEARALAGSGRENIVDGPAGSAQLAQPSGVALSADGGTVYFADSEVSAVRAFDLRTQQVSTLIGRGLFEFGDVDGALDQARLQHPLGVAVWRSAAGERVLVADTYNHKIKSIDPGARRITTLAGGGGSASGGAPAGELPLMLDEPGGLCVAGEGDAARVFVADTNHHRVVMIDPRTGAWREVVVRGLTGAGSPGHPVPAGAAAARVTLAPGREATLRLSPALAAGAHLSAEAPVGVRVTELGADRQRGRVLAQRTLRAERFPVEVTVPGGLVAPGRAWLVEVSYATCTEGDRGLCIAGEAAWVVEVDAGDATSAGLGDTPR